MRKLCYQIREEEAGMRVKDYFYQLGFSRQNLILLRDTNGIYVNHCPARTIDRLSAGSELTLCIPDDPDPAISSGDPAQILYGDDDVCVLNKPPFQYVHPVKQHQEHTLAGSFAAALGKQGRSSAFRPINRLDRDTSGAVVAALHPLAASLLSGRIKKRYLAVCDGVLTGSGTIALPIGREPSSLIERRISEDGQRAVTHWEVLASSHQKTLLSVLIDTGRTHQIRVHFRAIGHPLTGDTLYGTDDPMIFRQSLHCETVWFSHPITGTLMKIQAPIYEDMRRMLEHYFGTANIFADNARISRNMD